MLEAEATAVPADSITQNDKVDILAAPIKNDETIGDSTVPEIPQPPQMTMNLPPVPKIKLKL